MSASNTSRFYFLVILRPPAGFPLAASAAACLFLVVCLRSPSRGHDDDGPPFDAEPDIEIAEHIQELGRAVSDLNSPFAAVMVSPAPDLKCTLPGSLWPPCPALDDCYRVARTAFPGARLGLSHVMALATTTVWLL